MISIKSLTKKWFELLAVLFFVLGSFAAAYGVEPNYSWLSTMLIFLLALPAFSGLINSIKWRGLILLLLFGVLSLIVEATSIVLGFPYGVFSYSDLLGAKFLGLVPWVFPVACLPILLGSFTVAEKLVKGDLKIAGASAMICTLVDLVANPVAVFSGFWAWSVPGSYFGVPLINSVGCLLTGLVYSFILVKILPQGALPRMTVMSLVGALSFWSGFLIVNGLTFPGFLGLVLIVVLLKLGNCRENAIF